ncbi:MAG: type II toxin-antitoxin system prevent-host-death family antitoxin [Dehalococcoidia bacterium]
MRTIGATEFKAKCLKLLDEVDAEGITITKHGKPVARLVPAPADDDFRSTYGKYRDKMKVHGNLFSTGRKWNAQR